MPGKHNKLKCCCFLWSAFLLAHVLAFPLKAVLPFLQHLLVSLLHSELSLTIQNGLLIPFLESCRDNSPYILFILTVFLLFYAVFIYMNSEEVLLPFMGINDLDPAEYEMAEPLTLDQTLHKVKKCIGINWKQLAKRLGSSETEIDAIEYENRGELQEQIHQLFYRWKRCQGDNATKEVLLQAVASADLPVEKIQALKREGIYQELNEVQNSVQSSILKTLSLPLPSSEPYGLNIIAKRSHFTSPESDFPWNGILLSSTTPSMTIAVCTGGHFTLPVHTELVSPLYYISFGGETLNCDFYAEFQHSACILKDVQCERLQFVVAKLPHTHLSYQLLPFTHKKRFDFSSYSATISLSTSSHNGYLIGIVKPWTRYWVFASTNLRSKYYLQALLHSVSDSEYEVHIVVVKNLQPYIQMIEKKYPRDRFSTCGEAELSLQEHSPRPFYQSGITFYSPSMKGWRASFTTSATISRTKLESPDSYSTSSSLPRVTIIFTQETSEVQPSAFDLSCKLRLSGTAPPFSCSTLSLRAAG